MRKFEEIIEITADFLNSEEIPYMFVGAITVGYYGIPRTTLRQGMNLIDFALRVNKQYEKEQYSEK